MKKISLIVVSAVVVLTIVFFSCRKTSGPTEAAERQHPARKVTSFGKGTPTPTNPCGCESNYINTFCPDPCVRNVLMGNQAEASYTVTWQNCSSTDPNAGTQCPLNISYFTSKVKFCYGHPNNPTNDNCVILMQVDSVPPCVQCDGDHRKSFCMKLHATCATQNEQDFEVTLDDDDPLTPIVYQYEYSINRDDITFQVCCKQPAPGGGTYQYCCSGVMTKDP